VFRITWTCWIGLTAAGTGWLLLALPGQGPPSGAATVFLPGTTTDGHYQIEMNCSACHQSTGQVTDESCIRCHGTDLQRSRDTHPTSKFTDPTKAVLLEKIDAQNCLSCHVEHAEEHTRPMGVTVPSDYCIHCHDDVAESRPSHEGFSFDSCARSGCHNYHDNTALYENFLHSHLDEPRILETPSTTLSPLQQWVMDNGWRSDTRLTVGDIDAPAEMQSSEVVEEWARSAHALRGVNCSECHAASADSVDGEWVNRPNHDFCRSCHASEVEGFLEGRHGMRLGSNLTAMIPGMARRQMHETAGHKTLDCTACHSAHNPDTQFAAYQACVSCHDDEHSRNYSSSPHFVMWQEEISGRRAAGSGVSCATCHMPRDPQDGRVNHNQNANLRPNEKMARTVCVRCHGLQFTLDALADPGLLENCYATAPTGSVNSLEMVRDWFVSRTRGGSKTGAKAKEGTTMPVSDSVPDERTDAANNSVH